MAAVQQQLGRTVAPAKSVKTVNTDLMTAILSKTGENTPAQKPQQPAVKIVPQSAFKTFVPERKWGLKWWRGKTTVFQRPLLCLKVISKCCSQTHVCPSKQLECPSRLIRPGERTTQSMGAASFAATRLSVALAGIRDRVLAHLNKEARNAIVRGLRVFLQASEQKLFSKG